MDTKTKNAHIIRYLRIDHVSLTTRQDDNTSIVCMINEALSAAMAPWKLPTQVSPPVVQNRTTNPSLYWGPPKARANGP